MRRRVLTAVVLTTTLAVIAFFVPASVAIRNAQTRGELLELQREASIVANRLASRSGSTTTSSCRRSSTPITRWRSTDRRAAPGRHRARRARSHRAAGDGGQLRRGLRRQRPRRRDSGRAPRRPTRRSSSGSRSRAPRARSATTDRLALLARRGLAILAVAAAVGCSSPIASTARSTSSRSGPTRARAARTPPPDPTGIEELDSLRSALVDDHDRIEELLERERSFSSQVSHQLRTPVAAMRVAVETELAAPRPDATAVLHESLGQIDRLESTISSLLALARHTERDRHRLRHARARPRARRPLAGRGARDGRRLIVTGDPCAATSTPRPSATCSTCSSTIRCTTARATSPWSADDRHGRAPSMSPTRAGAAQRRSVRRHRQRFVARHRVAAGADAGGVVARPARAARPPRTPRSG